VKEKLASVEEESIKLTEEVNSLRRENHESKIKIIKLQSLEEEAKRLRKQLEGSEAENTSLQLSVTNLEQKVQH